VRVLAHLCAGPFESRANENPQQTNNSGGALRQTNWLKLTKNRQRLHSLPGEPWCWRCMHTHAHTERIRFGLNEPQKTNYDGATIGEDDLPLLGVDTAALLNRSSIDLTSSPDPDMQLPSGDLGAQQSGSGAHNDDAEGSAEDAEFEALLARADVAIAQHSASTVGASTEPETDGATMELTATFNAATAHAQSPSAESALNNAVSAHVSAVRVGE
jgi:hypothetical protein